MSGRCDWAIGTVGKRNVDQMLAAHAASAAHPMAADSPHLAVAFPGRNEALELLQACSHPGGRRQALGLLVITFRALLAQYRDAPTGLVPLRRIYAGQVDRH